MDLQGIMEEVNEVKSGASQEIRAACIIAQSNLVLAKAIITAGDRVQKGLAFVSNSLDSMDAN